MSIIPGFLSNLRRDQRGMTTVEYVIALCLVGALGVGTWNKFGGTVREKLELADQKIGNATQAGIDQGSDTANSPAPGGLTPPNGG